MKERKVTRSNARKAGGEERPGKDFGKGSCNGSPKATDKEAVDAGSVGTGGKHWFLGFDGSVLGETGAAAADGRSTGEGDIDGNVGGNADGCFLNILAVDEDLFSWDFEDNHLVSPACDGGSPSKLRPLELDRFFGCDGLWEKPACGIALQPLPTGQFLAQNVVFLAPMVNDARAFGRICGAAAVQPLLARGITPSVLSPLVEVPEEMSFKNPAAIRRLMEGFSDIADITGCRVAGGQITPAETLKAGAACSGLVAKKPKEPQVRSGHTLLLTKGIGAGVLAGAVKARREDWQDAEQTMIWSMGAPDQTAARLIQEFDLSPAWPVNRLGLAGHLLELVFRRNDLYVELWVDNVSLLDGAKDIAAEGLVPELTRINRHHFREYESWKGGVDEGLDILLHDACAVGGLLLAVPVTNLGKVVRAFDREDHPVDVIGKVKSMSGFAKNSLLTIVRG